MNTQDFFAFGMSIPQLTCRLDAKLWEFSLTAN
jgi:hypothetical protein